MTWRNIVTDAVLFGLANATVCIVCLKAINALDEKSELKATEENLTICLTENRYLYAQNDCIGKYLSCLREYNKSKSIDECNTDVVLCITKTEEDYDKK